MNKRIFLAAVLATTALAGCSSISSKIVRPLAGDGFVNAVNTNTDKLVDQLKVTKKVDYTPVIITSVQRIESQNACKETSILRDVVTARLNSHNYRVSEVAATGKLITVSNDSAMQITPEGQSAAAAVSADTIIAISWTTVPPREVPALMEKMNLGFGDKTYVTLKALRVSDGRVLGSQVFLTPDPINCSTQSLHITEPK